MLPADADASSGAADAVAGLARLFADRAVPVTLVAFDPAVDPDGNAAQIAERIGVDRISLIVVLDRLTGSVLHFITRNGDLIPAFDLYAQRAGARHAPTLGTAGTSFDWPRTPPSRPTRPRPVTGAQRGAAVLEARYPLVDPVVRRERAAPPASLADQQHAHAGRSAGRLGGPTRRISAAPHTVP